MWIRGIFSPTGGLGPNDIVLRLTALVLLLRPMGPWGVRPVILGAAALAIMVPRVLKTPATWYVISALVAVRIVTDWPLPDNHIYLLAYWCLAVALALGRDDGAVIIRQSSSVLIGLAFLMAVIWKGLLSADYLDGRFFAVTLLTDGRFEDATLLFGGLTKLQIKESRDYLQPLPEGAEWFEEPILFEPIAFKLMAMLSTWGLIILEALIALTFLFSLPKRFMNVRHLLLLSFCIITYAFAPVAGFGWLLLTMGIAGCNPEQRWLRATYIVVWGLVLLYEDVPWAGLLLEKWGRI